MGRTQPTFRRLVDQLYLDWSDYRRALRGAEREAFDALFRKAKGHASAAQLVTDPEPVHAVLMGVLLEHELELARLRARLALRGEVPEEDAEDPAEGAAAGLGAAAEAGNSAAAGGEEVGPREPAT